MNCVSSIPEEENPCKISTGEAENYGFTIYLLWVAAGPFKGQLPREALVIVVSVSRLHKEAACLYGGPGSYFFGWGKEKQYFHHYSVP